MQNNIDDLPIGGSSNANQMTEEFANPSSNAADNSGPLEERVVSKNWSVRATAFDELTQAFK